MDHMVPRRMWTREFRVEMDGMIKGRDGYGVPRFNDPSQMAKKLKITQGLA